MSVSWYVIRSKPNKEDFLARQFEARGMEVFHPRIRVRAVNPRARRSKPYFPGYIFIRADLEQVGQSILRWMPGTVGLVSFDNTPASIPETLVQAIRRRVDEINASERDMHKGLSKGQTVTIHSGPFAGYEAIFDERISGEERVRVLLQLVNKRQLPVELSPAQIQPKPNQGALTGRAFR